VIESKDQYLREQLVRASEVHYVRNKLRWCYMREGVNHYQNCRELTLQYMDILKEFNGTGWFKGYKLPIPKDVE
jgi:hypothetical protein